MQRRYTVALTATTVAGLAAAGLGVATAATAPFCSAASTPVRQVVNPGTQASLVTTHSTEAASARTEHGFTVDNGVIFAAPGSGFTAVVRLRHPGSGDFLWSADPAEIENAVQRYGYEQQQTDFHASPTRQSCTVAVHRLVKGPMHRLTPESGVAALQAAGWSDEGVKFHAFPAPAAPTSPASPPVERPLASVLAGGKLGSATYTFGDFAISKDGQQAGAVLPAAGLTGRGKTSVVRIQPRTSTRAAMLPPDDPAYTNPLDLLLVTGTAKAPAAPVLQGFTLQGTAQGHIYNGLRLSYTKGARITDVRVVAVPGNYHINPGETFGVNDWRGSGNTYTDVEVDGAGLGATALGTNSSENVTVTRAHLHDNPYSAGVAAWQTRNLTLTDVRTVNNRTGLNFERVEGTVTITRPTIQGNKEQDLFIGSDFGSAKYTITDPVLTPGAKLRIRLPKNEMGKPNLQSRSDIRVLIAGKDVTSSLVQWL